MQHIIEQSFVRDLETHRKGEELSAVQQYHIDCWRTYRAITASVKKLQIAQECVMHAYLHAPQDKNYALLIEFNIENYLIRSRGVYDRVLIFTNSLCDIQMSHDYVEHACIITNKKVVNADLKSSLKSINKACSVYRDERNTVVHKDKYTDENISWADTALKAKAIMGDEDFIKAGLTDLQISERIAYAVSRHVEEFESNSKSITEKVCEFLSLAMRVYDAKASIT